MPKKPFLEELWDTLESVVVLKTPPTLPPERIGKHYRDQLTHVLSTLTRRQEKLVRLRFGLGDGVPRSQEVVAAIFKTSRTTVARIEREAFERLKAIESGLFARRIQIRHAVETADALTPDLMSHLKSHHDDLDKIPWDVAEELVAEWLASTDFEDVTLVGRDKTTAADVFAVSHTSQVGIPIKLFVEVKWQKDKVGIEVIDRVLGAIVREQPKIGWTCGMIVSLGGYTNFKGESHESLALRGLQLRQKEDLLRWLEDYHQAPNGLWLPPQIGPGTASG